MLRFLLFHIFVFSLLSYFLNPDDESSEYVPDLPKTNWVAYLEVKNKSPLKSVSAGAPYAPRQLPPLHYRN